MSGCNYLKVATTVHVFKFESCPRLGAQSNIAAIAAAATVALRSTDVVILYRNKEMG